MTTKRHRRQRGGNRPNEATGVELTAVEGAEQSTQDTDQTAVVGDKVAEPDSIKEGKKKILAVNTPEARFIVGCIANFNHTQRAVNFSDYKFDPSCVRDACKSRGESIQKTLKALSGLADEYPGAFARLHVDDLFNGAARWFTTLRNEKRISKYLPDATKPAAPAADPAAAPAADPAAAPAADPAAAPAAAPAAPAAAPEKKGFFASWNPFGGSRRKRNRRSKYTRRFRS